MEFILFKVLLCFSDRLGERPWAGIVRKLFKIFLVGIAEGGGCCYITLLIVRIILEKNNCSIYGKFQ